MSNRWLLAVMVVIGSLVVVGYVSQAFKGQGSQDDKRQVGAAGADESISLDFQTQTKRLGAVDVEVVAKLVSVGDKIILGLSLDTHSVDLGYDYTKIAVLVDDQGNRYQVLEWTGGRGGHHLSGDLIFEPLKEGAASLSLTLAGIDDQTGVFNLSM